MEAVGLLASLCLPQHDWRTYLERHSLPAWLAARLIAGNADDDIILECVMLAGAVCNAGSAPLLAHAELVSSAIPMHAIRKRCMPGSYAAQNARQPLLHAQGQLLITLLEDRRHDDEFVLQILGV